MFRSGASLRSAGERLRPVCLLLPSVVGRHVCEWGRGLARPLQDSVCWMNGSGRAVCGAEDIGRPFFIA